MKEAFEKIRKRIVKLYGETPPIAIINPRIEDVKESNAYLKCLEIVSEVEAEYGNGWILCSERLPEKYGRYLVCNDGVAWIADFFNSTWFGKRCRYSDVIAWMPLPEPYKPET